jgi:hypothetical protein
MPVDFASFSTRRSGGIRHPPEADIESIRDLLRGYGSSRSILKELIQNAEDARASRMDMLYLPGDPTAPHALMRGPGLLVANDGEFTQEHRDAITQINLGTKGTEERAIGRFGKGLKSVFAWCEAFFIIAQTDPELGWPATSIIDFFNPWHGWRHQDWEEEFSASAEILSAMAAEHLASTYPPGKPWLAFWFPLRSQSHARDSMGTVAWIYEDNANRLPADDPEFYATLCDEFRTLAPSLVCLTQLQGINIVNDRADDHHSLLWQFPEKSERIPLPDTAPAVKAVNGITILSETNNKTITYRHRGFAGRLPDERVQHLKAARDWPKVVQRTRDQSDAGCQAKGEPHFATLVTSNSQILARPNGVLDIRWCVFFPVGKQPQGTAPVILASIPHDITINLHGFFFLDSERLRIDGLDERFDSKDLTGNQSCLKWNHIVATEGALACLPASLAAFAEQELLDGTHCCDLAEAIRKTWLWSHFHAEVCGIETWRPRWRADGEKWERVSAETPVFVIPSPTDHLEILARIPMLIPLSDELTLIAKSNDGSLPGLHDDKISLWSEELVLQLLTHVELGATGDEATANWLNTFFNSLQEHNVLTPKIRERASLLPLLRVRSARTNKQVRVSAREWYVSIEADNLFGSDNRTDGWLRLLLGALPDWSCFVTTETSIPRWFIGPRPPICDGNKAAKIALTQSNLGSFIRRTELVAAFTSLAGPDSTVRLAMRFLMHASANHARDSTKLLFMPSAQQDQQIWSRLIEQLLKNDGGADSWRLLHTEWASVLSPHVQQELGISTVDANGAWEELTKGQVDFHALEFAPELWSTDDISALLQGLFQAGQSRQNDTVALLRKLRLHILRGRPNERVSVADETGQLGDVFVLDTPGFENGIPLEIQPLWQVFLSETKIVERLPANDLASTVQNHLFQRADSEGTAYPAELDWNFVVRHSLEAVDPSERTRLILQGLAQGNQAATGLGKQLRTTKWLPLAMSHNIAPDSIIHIEGLEEDLHQLLDPIKDGIAGIHSLPEWISTHDGFPTLRNYLPRIEQALEFIGLWLDTKPRWHLGLSKTLQLTELEPLLFQLKDLETLPVAAFLVKLREIRIRGFEQGLDSLLQACILPRVLKRFDYEQGGRERIETILSRLQTSQGRSAFDAYLIQASEDGVLETILPNLSLVNQKGHWISARQLIWPSSNLDPAAQLNHEQAEILTALHREPVNGEPQALGNQQGPLQIRGNQLTEPPDFGAEVAKLADYLKTFRNVNVGDVLPAGLVAVLGGHSATLALLRELLESGLRQQPDVFLAMLLGEHTDDLAPAMESTRFLVDIVREGRTEARTITGEYLTVELTAEINTLLVGDPSDLFWTYTYHSRADTACHVIRLRWIENPDNLGDAVAVFASTIETILLKAHCNGVSTLCPTNIKEVLGGIADAGQADLRRSQIYLLDMAEARLKELAVKGLPKFDAILQKFDDARQARVDQELLRSRIATKAQKRGEEAKELAQSARQDLLVLLESDQESETRRTLVDAVRRKMTDFQYNMGSVPFELFQNADDAVAELEEMQNGLDPKAHQFVLNFNRPQRLIEVFHWGRPINRHEFPGFLEGRKRGYDQDLQKMLTLNFSDKGVTTERGPAIVTGLFGLGFKSVFFVSEQPQVISGRLAFEIRGGFFPVPLSPTIAEEIRNNARPLSATGLIPTGIRLTWGQQVQEDDLCKALDNFKSVAPLLTVFSRCINTLIVVDGVSPDTWTNVEEPLTESGRVIHAQVGNMSFCCFRCPLHSDQRAATVLFLLNANGIAPLADDVSGLWITTPTAERSDFRWALNAPFKPDAGRQRLALTNPENRDIAEEVASAWGTALIELFDETSTRWEQFAEQLELHSAVNANGWWRQVWNEMARSSPTLYWEELHDGGQMLEWIAWGKDTGAMRRLIQERAVIPTELLAPYSKLVKSGDVRFYVCDLLAEKSNGCFAQIAQWESAQQAFPPGQTVHSDIGDFLQQTKSNPHPIQRVTLERVLAVDLGPRREVDYLVADRVGALFTKCKSVFEPNTPHASEVQRLHDWLKQTSLLAKDDSYHSAQQLVSGRALTDLIEEDEVLRAAFAPDSAVLSPTYSDSALSFFSKARGQLTANAVTLANWVRAGSNDRLDSVFRYLISGELGQQLADQLQRPWLESNRASTAFQNLTAEGKSEVERKFFRGQLWTMPTEIPSPMTMQFEIEQVMDAEEAFRLVSQWWHEEEATWVSRYEAKTYPAGFPGTLPWPGEEGWDNPAEPTAQSRWLILFIHAALVPLGFNKIGRDQSFSEFLVSRNWLDVFTKVSINREALLAAIDDYLDGFIQNTEFHFQMRQFVAFYAASRNLEAFLDSLRTAESTIAFEAFTMVFSPNANPNLTGTGISAPPLTGMLGIGTHQLLRELYRLKRLKNPAGYRFAFTPIRKVRRLCTQLFGISEGHTGAESSMNIFLGLQELSEGLGMDPTFDGCFDLPLQFLAQDPELRARVLNVTFEAESDDDETLDAAPRKDIIL